MSPRILRKAVKLSKNFMRLKPLEITFFNAKKIASTGINEFL